MGYFWLNSNSKWRASLSLPFETLTKDCEQVGVDVKHGSGWNILFMCFSWKLAASEGECGLGNRGKYLLEFDEVVNPYK